MYFLKTGSFRPNQSRLDRFRSVNRFIRWTGPVTGSGFKNIGWDSNNNGTVRYIVLYMDGISRYIVLYMDGIARYIVLYMHGTTRYIVMYRCMGQQGT